jgi:predicted metal-dependent HD superfamily phosphohydrolase
MADRIFSLHSAWQRALQDLDLPGEHVVLRDRLVAAYAEPHRRYHTLQHLGECLNNFDHAREFAQRPGEVAMALWFHDAVYDLARHDNEAQSADWAVAELKQAGAAGDACARVHALIMATRHSALPRTQDERLLVDIDLSILGAASARFDEYEVQVRHEYASVPEADFQRRRRQILQGFLERPAIFTTPWFHGSLEVQARDNLARSIAALAASGGTG